MSRPLCLSIEDLIQYSQCPKKYNYSRTLYSPPSLSQSPSQFDPVLREIILRAYNKTALGIAPTWQTIGHWIENRCFQDVDLANATAFTDALDRSVQLRQHLFTWYHKHLAQEGWSYFVNWPISLWLDDHAVLETRLGLLRVSDQELSLIWLRGRERPEEHPLKDLATRIHVYLLYYSFGILPTSLDFVTSGPKKVTIEQVRLEPKRVLLLVQTTRKIIQHLAAGIMQQTFYPIVSLECQGCLYNKHCPL